MREERTTNNKQLKIELLSQWKLEAEFRKKDKLGNSSGKLGGKSSCWESSSGILRKLDVRSKKKEGLHLIEAGKLGKLCQIKSSIGRLGKLGKFIRKNRKQL